MFKGVTRNDIIVVIGFLALFSFALIDIWTKPQPTVADQQRVAEEQQRRKAAEKQREAEAKKMREQEYETKRYLCRVSAACKKYDATRLECATAGNFKTCLRIKMGDDAYYIESCSGYNEGAPALPRPPNTPNTIECFLLLAQ